MKMGVNAETMEQSNETYKPSCDRYQLASLKKKKKKKNWRYILDEELVHSDNSNLGALFFFFFNINIVSTTRFSHSCSYLYLRVTR